MHNSYLYCRSCLCMQIRGLPRIFIKLSPRSMIACNVSDLRKGFMLSNQAADDRSTLAFIPSFKTLYVIIEMAANKSYWHENVKNGKQFPMYIATRLPSTFTALLVGFIKLLKLEKLAKQSPFFSTVNKNFCN